MLFHSTPIKFVLEEDILYQENPVSGSPFFLFSQQLGKQRVNLLLRPDHLNTLPQVAQCCMAYLLYDGQPTASWALCLDPQKHTAGQQNDPIRETDGIVRDEFDTAPACLLNLLAQVRFNFFLRRPLFQSPQCQSLPILYYFYFYTYPISFYIYI